MEEQTQYIIPPQPLQPNQSQDIGKLAEALAKAQGSMEGAKKDAKNPFFKSEYSTLHSVWDACRGPLSANGLAVIQTTEGYGDVIVVTTLCHSSGQWIRGKLSVKPQKTDSQALGSCITYLRRYALAAIVGLSPVDDDGESTMARQDINKKIQEKKPAPKKSEPKVDMPKFIAAVSKLTEEMGMSAEIFDSFMSDEKVKSLDVLKTKDAQIDFYNKLKSLFPAPSA